ncbi:hypothetical protein M3A49_40815 [Paraburkholderia sp. CNPSo 3076]|uniref:hypothetical protein n=1 Tax=Paraburkholderia sp. CNPSo 3076 TaxID=2940936 RepID=UPI0022559AB3|nr:hypothetical protein [Paraburkholderia sp. CNPSo 3076]MCX5545690.1 hypothetical protein [Paraburkholderia sp. CNPSo 3076]
MRILRPAEVQNMARGEPVTPCNRSSDNASSSSTSNNYADKRNAVQNGIGVSGDNNQTSYSSYSVTTDQGAVQAGIGAAVAALGTQAQTAAAAINGTAAVAANANSSMTDVSKSVVAATSHLADVGLSMLQTNTALANSLEGGVNQTTQAVTGLAQQLASTQIASQNDNRYLIAAGLAVVAIVGVAAFSKKAA